MTSVATPSHRFAPGLLVLAGGLVAGTLDIVLFVGTPSAFFARWALLHRP